VEIIVGKFNKDEEELKKKKQKEKK